MTRAEELARKFVLPMLDNHYAEYGENKQMQLSRFDGLDILSSYEEGYQQAEEDLALTWRDLEEIVEISNSLEKEWLSSTPWDGIKEHWFYQEVLKRFNEKKKIRKE